MFKKLYAYPANLGPVNTDRIAAMYGLQFGQLPAASTMPDSESLLPSPLPKSVHTPAPRRTYRGTPSRSRGPLNIYLPESRG